jgi:hypothetical protein
MLVTGSITAVRNKPNVGALIADISILKLSKSKTNTIHTFQLFMAVRPPLDMV